MSIRFSALFAASIAALAEHAACSPAGPPVTRAEVSWREVAHHFEPEPAGFRKVNGGTSRDLFYLSLTADGESQLEGFIEVRYSKLGWPNADSSSDAPAQAAWVIDGLEPLVGKAAGFVLEFSPMVVTYRMVQGRLAFSLDFDLYLGDLETTRAPGGVSLDPNTTYHELVTVGFTGRDRIVLQRPGVTAQRGSGPPLAVLHKHIEFVNTADGLVATESPLQVQGGDHQLAVVFESPIVLAEGSALGSPLPLGNPLDTVRPCVWGAEAHCQ